MYFALVAASAIVIAVLRGVSLVRLADTRFAGLAWLAFAVLLRVALNPYLMTPQFAAAANVPPVAGAPSLGGLLYIGSFAFALLFLLANRNQAGFWFILAGLALNLVAIVANGGQMPGDAAQLARGGLLDVALSANDGRWAPSGVTSSSTRLYFLCDVIYVPMPFRSPTLISVGDLAISLGVLAFVNQVRTPLRRRASAATR